MGFDFYIINSDRDIVQSLYFSYNWSCLKDYWYIRNDLLGQTTEDAVKKIEEVLKKVTEEGYKKCNPDDHKDNSSWGWGVSKEGGMMPKSQLMGVFIYHLEHFLEVAKANPECTFVDSENFHYEDEE